MSSDNGYVYISSVNVVSTLIAYYGLTVLRLGLKPELEHQFVVTGKIASLQLTLLTSAIPNLIIGLLVSTDVIRCSSLFPSKARGEGMLMTHYNRLVHICSVSDALWSRDVFAARRSGSFWSGICHPIWVGRAGVRVETHMVYLLPISSYLAGFKSVSALPSVRPGYDDKYRSINYRFVLRQNNQFLYVQYNNIYTYTYIR